MQRLLVHLLVLILWIFLSATPAHAAISYIGKATGTNSATLPSFSVGDLAVVFAYRDGSTTAPSLPSGWTNIGNSGANTNSSRVGYRVLQSGDTTTSTWTNATSVVVMVYRGQDSTTPIGTSSGSGTASTTVTYNALTLQITDGSSWVLGVAGHRSTNTNLQNAPTGMTNRATVVDATDEAAGHDSNGGISSWGAQNVSVGGTSSGWRAWSIEIRSTPITTLADGTNPINSTLAPGTSITDLDAFTLTTSSGTDSVTAATLTLAAGTYAGLSELRITSDDGATTYFSAITDPASDTVNFSGGTPIPVTTSTTTFKIRLTPKSHGNMPAVPGSSYAVTGTVTAWTSTNGQAGSDTGSATITIDNTSPSNVTDTSGSTNIEQVNLSWTNPGDADFSQVVVLRRANSSVGDAPAEGAIYSVGNTIGSSTVACVTASTGCTDSGIPGAIPYHYKIFALDSRGNYSSGAVPTGSPFTPTALIISISITSDGSINYGLVNPGSAKSTFDLSDTQTVRNDSNVAADLTIKTSSATGGTPWTIGASAGNNIFVHEFSLNSGGNWTKFSAADSYQSFVTNLGVSASQNFDLRLTVPTATSDYQQKTVTVTILATQH